MKSMKKIVQILLVIALVVGAAQSVSATSYAESMYYPLWKLSTYEYWSASYLSPGTVIVVRPGYSWSVTKYSSAERMVTSNSVRTIVLPGVGSSSRGAAAMAKLVANELGQSVAAVVTGRGDWTTMTEGLEGYWIGRSSNLLQTYYSNSASYKLYSMYRNGARPYRLIGHSKGSFDAINALFRLKNEGRSSYFSQTTFISFGLGLFVPAGLHGNRQYEGTLDTLGATNNTTIRYITPVIGSGHSLNTLMPIAMSVRNRLYY